MTNKTGAISLIKFVRKQIVQNLRGLDWIIEMYSVQQNDLKKFSPSAIMKETPKVIT
jgi:hypothetical protein